MQIPRFTSSKPSEFAFASDEKSIRQPTASFVRCCPRRISRPLRARQGQRTVDFTCPYGRAEHRQCTLRKSIDRRMRKNARCGKTQRAFLRAGRRSVSTLYEFGWTARVYIAASAVIWSNAPLSISSLLVRLPPTPRPIAPARRKSEAFFSLIPPTASMSM